MGSMKLDGPIPLFVLGWLLPLTAGAGQGANGSSVVGEAKGNWPQFRGPHARGVADDAAVPASWDAATMARIKWKTPIPGLGHSSPIIWGDRLFVTTCISGRPNPPLRVGLYGDIEPLIDNTNHRWRVYCLDKKTGRMIWERTARQGVPSIKRHPKSTHANSTPATDGKHVVAFFGSEGLYCYDFDGELLWKKDLGVLDAGYWKLPAAQWAFGSSPIIFKNMVIVQCDVQGDSFLAALDLKDGREIWRTPRRDVCTWSSPTVHEGPDRVELIANGYRHIGGYDPFTGRALWKMGGGSDIPVPTPFVAHDLIFITSSHRGPHPLYAIRLGASGDITLKEGETSSRHVAWGRLGRGTYMQTPIVYGDYLYTCRDNGVLTCYDARTGGQQYRTRLGGGGTGFTASAVAADGKLFYTSEDGDIYVLQAGAEPELLGINSMGEVCMATPAISDGRIYIRTQRHHCIDQHQRPTFLVGADQRIPADAGDGRPAAIRTAAAGGDRQPADL